MSAKINTVNVIEYRDDAVLAVQSFIDCPEGNKEAESVFSTILKEHEVDEKDIESFVEDGFWEEGDFQLFLTHSS